MKSTPASLLLALATVLTVVVIALRLFFAPPEIVVPEWIAEQGAPPVVLPPIADNAPVRADVGPAVLPIAELANALVQAKPKVQFQATTDLAVALSKTVAEEMMASLSPYLENSLKAVAEGRSSPIISGGTLLFASLPDFAKLTQQGDIKVDVVCRTKVNRAPLMSTMVGWVIDEDLTIAKCIVDTPSYIVTLTFKRPAANPETFDSLFPKKD